MQTTQLPFFAVIRATGSDAADFLHNQFSNDIKNLQANQACYATYNTPKGRVIANLIAQNTGNEILLALAADLAEAVVKRLKMYVLRAKVQFEILPDWGVAGSLKSNTPPQHPSEPQLSFPVNAQGEIQLPHTGSLKIAPRKPNTQQIYKSRHNTVQPISPFQAAPKPPIFRLPTAKHPFLFKQKAV